MKNLILKLYQILPKTLKNKIGKSKLLKVLRTQLLYTATGFKIAKVSVNRTYHSYNVKFNFFASFKIASKAKHQGIENTVLLNSITLVNTYFKGRHDIVTLDVGANFGYLSMVWANSISKKGKVFSIESNKKIAACLEKTKASNRSSNFEVSNLAVGASDKIITLNASNFSSNTLEMDTKIESYAINMVTLDSYVKTKNIVNVNLIKIDVDGIELDILKGAINTLKNYRPIVIVETNDNKAIVNYINSLQYNIFDMSLNLYDATKPLPLNIFCVPKEY